MYHYTKHEVNLTNSLKTIRSVYNINCFVCIIYFCLTCSCYAPFDSVWHAKIFTSIRHHVQTELPSPFCELPSPFLWITLATPSISIWITLVSILNYPRHLVYFPSTITEFYEHFVVKICLYSNGNLISDHIVYFG